MHQLTVLPRARFTREFPLCPRRSDDKITACYAYAGRLESMGLIVNCVNLDQWFYEKFWVVVYEIIDFRVEKYIWKYLVNLKERFKSF